MGESNAESVLREEEIKKDVKRMKQERRLKPTHRIHPKRHNDHITNNVTEVNLQADYSLYANPDKHLNTHPVPVLYDTGAAISMLSSEPSWA